MVRLIEEDFAEERCKRFLLNLIASADGGHRGHHNVAASESVELGRSGLSCQHAHDRIEDVYDDAQFPQEPVLPELICRLLPQSVCGHYDQDAITARFDGDGQHDLRLPRPCGHHNDGRVFAQAPVRRYRVERADLRCAQARPSSVPLNCKKLGNVVEPASP